MSNKHHAMAAMTLNGHPGVLSTCWELTKHTSSPRLKITRWWFEPFLILNPNLGRYSSLTNIFQKGWLNHQLVHITWIILDLFKVIFTLYQGKSPQTTIWDNRFFFFQACFAHKRQSYHVWVFTYTFHACSHHASVAARHAARERCWMCKGMPGQFLWKRMQWNCRRWFGDCVWVNKPR